LPLQAGQQVAASSVVENAIGSAPVPYPADMHRHLLAIPIGVIGKYLLDLGDVLLGDTAGSATQEDGFVIRIRNLWVPAHGTHHIRLLGKLPEGRVSCLAR
jgi:hypothetical protein